MGRSHHALKAPSLSKCPSCALSMDGKSEHALLTSGYTLHFCTEGCKTRFDEKPQAFVAKDGGS